MVSSNRGQQSNVSSRTTNAAASAERPSNGRLSASAMETLWERMAAIYGHRWTSSFGDAADGLPADTWSGGLAGLTGDQLGRGLKACVTSADPWPPTLPQFRAMCLSIPTLETVRAELHKDGRGTVVATPFAMLVWQHIDGFTYWQADGRVAAAILKAAYDGAREFVMAGGDLPEALVAIAAPDGASQRRSERIAYIRQQHHYGAITCEERDLLIEEAMEK